MLSLPGILIALGAVLALLLGLLIVAAPALGCKPQRRINGWQFPVKLTCHLLYGLALLTGLGVVDLAAHLLGTAGLGSLSSWVLFAAGVGGTLLVITDWPEPLIADHRGLRERGTTGQISWALMSGITAYRVRLDRGVLVHGKDGQQIAVAEMVYDAESVLTHLRTQRGIGYQPLYDDAPLSILIERNSHLLE